jgi:integrase
LHKTKRPARRLNFTKRTLAAIRVRSDGGRETVFDENTPGLGFTVFPTGVRSFFHYRFVRGRPQRTTIGRYPEVSVEQARGKASDINARIAKWRLNNYEGERPFGSGRRDPTFGEVVTQYVEQRIRKHSGRPDRAAKAIEWRVRKYLPSWSDRKLVAITSEDVGELHRRLGTACGNPTANRTVEMVRTIFYWAAKAKLWSGKNPVAGIDFFFEGKRKRYLQAHELQSFFKALGSEQNADLRDFVGLALWTGARRGDVFSMRWEDISFTENRWQIPDPKNRESYSVPLIPDAVKILKARERRRKADSSWVFPSHGATGHVIDLKGAWRKFLQRAGLADKDLRQHDLRRTLGSYQAAQGTSLNIIAKSLGHTSLGATQIYAQLDLDPVRLSVMSVNRAIVAASKKKPKAGRK